MPYPNNMAFVVILHLSAEYESQLSTILQTTTSMPVIQVKETIKVEANHVYTIPPNSNLAIARGILKLQPRPRIRGPLRSIDTFFESLAQDQHQRAIVAMDG